MQKADSTYRKYFEITKGYPFQSSNWQKYISQSNQYKESEQTKYKSTAAKLQV